MVDARIVSVAGVAALLGGVAWVVKGAAIPATGDQPPLLFGVALPLFGIALVGVTVSTMPASRWRTTAIGLGGTSVVAGVVALAGEARDMELHAAIAVSALALVAGLLMLRGVRRWPAPLAWWIGVATVPAQLVGGALAEIDERLLEVPHTALGLAWAVFGWAMLRA